MTFSTFFKLTTSRKNENKTTQEVVTDGHLSKTISVEEPYYYQHIKRICFRSEIRAPEEVFSNGMSKQIVSPTYAKEIQDVFGEYQKTLRIKKPFESFRPTTIAFSQRFESAVFFPDNFKNVLIYQELKKFVQKIEKLSSKEAFSYALDLAKELNLSAWHCHEFIHEDKKGRENLLNKFAQTKLCDEIWLYVTYIENGFNVHQHGYQATQKEKTPPFTKFFAEEICTEKVVPSQYIFAAFKMARDFTKAERSTVKTNDNEWLIVYGGEVSFKILDLVYNKEAINFFKQELHLDTDKIKALLEKYYEQHKEYGLVHLSKDGYHKTETSFQKTSP